MITSLFILLSLIQSANDNNRLKKMDDCERLQSIISTKISSDWQIDSLGIELKRLKYVQLILNADLIGIEENCFLDALGTPNERSDSYIIYNTSNREVNKIEGNSYLRISVNNNHVINGIAFFLE